MSEFDFDVSIIIPVYNRKNYIPLSIQSVLGEADFRTEVIVIDDGSTDGSDEVIKTFGDEIIFLQKLNGGVSSARNTGLKAARGRLVYFLDSDDLAIISAIKETLVLQENDGNTILVGKATIFTDANSHAVSSRLYAIRDYQRGELISPINIVSQVVSCSLCLYPRDLLREIEGFDCNMSYGEDYDLNARCAIAGHKFFATGIEIVKVRIHHGQRLSRSIDAEQLQRLYTSILRVVSEGQHIFNRVNTAQPYRQIARWMWTLGRLAYCHRLGEIGDMYTSLAEEMAGRECRVGSKVALLAYRLVSPKWYEFCSSLVKTVTGPLARRLKLD